MRISNSFKTAIIGLKTNKVRSALTMLGIIIGISAVISVVSLGNATKQLIIGQIVATGSNNIYIEPGSFDPKKVSMMQSMMEEMEITTLKYDDAVALEKLPEVEMAAPYVMGVASVVYKGIDKKITFLGITPNAHRINDQQTAIGRPMSEEDIKSHARVVVLGYNLKNDLFGEKNSIGEMIRIKRTNFRVIGVMEELGSEMFMNLDDYAYVPITSAQKVLLGTNHVRQIIVKAVSEDKVNQAVDNIRFLLRERHNIYNPTGDLSKDDFKVMSQVEAAEMLDMITGIFTLFLSSVASIALIVGGIGIMNIMLVSVTERTREIGLRKAVGARRKDILYQFLIEAVVLTVVGGVIGIILGLGGSFIIGLLIKTFLGFEWVFSISLSSVILACGVSTIIGLIFGIYPARKAASLSPIEALRYE